jgi:hypothetical protein
MNYTDLLMIYDADDWLMRRTGRLRPADEVVGVTGGIKGLLQILDQFVAQKRVFGRAVFHTHGNEGFIALGDEKGNKIVSEDVLKNRFAGRKYDTLFAYNARIYFNGCKVARGDKGWTFLETAASTFLGRFGGTTFGHTEDGRPLTPYLGVFGGVAGLALMWKNRGKSYHFTGEARYVYTSPGGMTFSRWTD